MQEEVSEGWGEPLGLALAPGTQVAGFTLEAQLATGGAGTVYRARRGGQCVALKVIPRDDWGEREVDALRRVRHAQVVGLLGYGVWPEQRPRYLVLALELVEERALDAWAREHNPSARRLVEGVLLPLARALAQVHAAGVVHRDVKEANVVVREADGQAVLVDFGSARYEGAPRLTERMPPGTREYRSPELLRFALEWEGGHYPSRPADDLWALGVTLYWLLTRELPFGDRSGPLVRRILEQAPQAVREANPRVPGALGELCLRMLQKEPLERYADAPALVQALEAMLARADDTWSVPLFPPEPRELGALPPPSGPLPSPAAGSPPGLQGVRARRARGSAWLVPLAVGLGLLSWRLTHVLAPTPLASGDPRAASSGQAPPRQAGPRQEVAPVRPTGDVGSDAGPVKSPPPAPVAHATHPEEAPVFKSHKTRSTLATAVLAGTACGAGGCASAPQPVVDSPPSPIPCPEGSSATHRKYAPRELSFPAFITLVMSLDPVGDPPTVHDGEPIRAFLFDKWGAFEPKTPVVGRLQVWKDRIYGRFTDLTLPSGEHVPICLELYSLDHRMGVPMQPGSTRAKAMIPWGPMVLPVTKYEAP